MEALDQALAFSTPPHVPPCEVRVNFGIFAGRPTTPAEIDDLAALLLPELGDVTIVAEDRHELSSHSEVSLHQVRIDLREGSRTRARAAPRARLRHVTRRRDRVDPRRAGRAARLARVRRRYERAGGPRPDARAL